MRPKKVILLVDDNDVALSTRRFLLETRGYRVLAATTPHEALEIAEAAMPLSIDLLLTDFVMPQMEGSELARRFRLVHPETPTMIVSGSVTAIASHHAHAFLPKGEATPAELLERIRILCVRKRGPKMPPQSVSADLDIRREIA